MNAGWLRFAAAVFTSLFVSATPAQDKTFKQEQLDQILAPIALYPDSLLSQVLMAATYPADVAAAATWSKAHLNDKEKGDAAVKKVENEDWDPSVKSLVAFPSVLGMMGDKPDWVQQLGNAFLAQPDDVMNTVQGLRKRAQDQGNLKSNEQQKVVVEQQKIIIEPAQPQTVYVPAYNPTVVYGPWWYPAYPAPFYWPPPPYYGFGAVVATGVAWGVAIGVSNAIWGGINWGHNDVNINVNRYNNVNVNNRINNASGNNVNWQHNANNRKGVPYGDAGTRQKYDRQVAGANDRQQYRGKQDSHSADRARAEQTMRDRGIDSPGRNGAGGAGSRDARPGGAGNDRPGAGADRPGAGAGTRDLDHGAAQRPDRGGAASGNRDNAFSGAGNPGGTRDAINRGQASNTSMNRSASRPAPASRPTPHAAPRGGGGGGRGRR